MSFNSLKVGQTKHAMHLSFCHCKDDRTEQSITLHICDSTIASLRGMSKANDEAIHNVGNPKILNGEIKDYRLPQPLTRLRNDKRTDTLESRHCEDCKDEAIHNQAKSGFYNGQTYFKDSIAKASLCNIIDCHDSLRNLAMTENPSPRNDSPTYRIKVAQ